MRITALQTATGLRRETLTLLHTGTYEIPELLRNQVQGSSPLEEIAGFGAEILIPVHNGELSTADFYRRAVEASGPALVPANVFFV